MKLDTKMRPNDMITRQEAFTILARALKMTGGVKSDFNNFGDSSRVANWAVSAIGAMVKAGYIRGENNLLNPTVNMTRAQFAVTMHNLILKGALIIGDDVVVVDDTAIPAGGSGRTRRPAMVEVSAISITGTGNATIISTDNGTLQMSADVGPAGATNKAVTWSVVDGTGSALQGTTATVVAGTFNAANAGTDGSYTFAVTIDKGAETQVTSAVKTMTITATVTVAGFNFDDVSKTTPLFTSYTADNGISVNISPTAITPAVIKLHAANWKEFITGVTGKAANAEGWNSTSDSYWCVEFSTINYKDLSLYSKQRGSNTGPKDFKVQWSTDNSSWADVSGASITVTTAFSAAGGGSLNNIVLPRAVENQATVYLRWITTSTTSINGGVIGSAGTNNIDDIVITGAYDATQDNLDIVAEWVWL